MNAAQPASSIPLADVDPALRDEFRHFMAGFAPETDDISSAAQHLRHQQNAARSRRAKAAAEASPPTVATPVRPVSSVPSLPAQAVGFTKTDKPRRRHLPVVAPKATAAASRTALRLRAYRQNIIHLFLTENEVIEECPGLRPHMVRLVML